jgi:hypothetical protein
MVGKKEKLRFSFHFFKSSFFFFKKKKKITNLGKRKKLCFSPFLFSKKKEREQVFIPK